MPEACAVNFYIVVPRYLLTRTYLAVKLVPQVRQTESASIKYRYKSMKFSRPVPVQHHTNAVCHQNANALMPAAETFNIALERRPINVRGSRT